MKALTLHSLALFLTFCSASNVDSGFQRQRSQLTSREDSSNCSEPQPDECTFYPQCLEPKVQCGSEGYPIAYGLNYCTLFTDVASEMSDEGQEWITNTMLCLQNALVPYGTDGTESTTCDDLRSYAFGTHPDCYVGGGFCTLPPSDWAVVVETVGLAELFGSLEALKAVLETGKDCGELYVWLVANGIIDAVKDNGDD